jgi:hypothetical protein
MQDAIHYQTISAVVLLLVAQTAYVNLCILTSRIPVFLIVDGIVPDCLNCGGRPMCTSCTISEEGTMNQTGAPLAGFYDLRLIALSCSSPFWLPMFPSISRSASWLGEEQSVALGWQAGQS